MMIDIVKKLHKKYFKFDITVIEDAVFESYYNVIKLNRRIKNIENYIFISAKNYLLKEAKRNKRCIRLEEPQKNIANRLEHYSKDITPDFSEPDFVIIDAIRHELNCRDFKIFTLHNCDGYSYSQITHYLDMKANTVIKIDTKSKKYLRDFFNKADIKLNCLSHLDH